MPNSTRSSSASASCRQASPASLSCRLQWRPSRWLHAALLALAALAAFSILASEMPRAAAWPLALAALGHGVLLLLRERGRPPRELLLHGAAAPTVDGVPIADFDLRWRGPLAFAAWRDADGRRQRATWWPDTLAPAQRRELRLAMPPPPAARRRRSMAP